MVNMGLTLFGDANPEAGSYSFRKRSLLIDHESKHQIKGLISLIGARATMARRLAETAIDLVLRKIGRPVTKSRSAEQPIYGGYVDDFDELVAAIPPRTRDLRNARVRSSLAHNYGSRYRDILAYCDNERDLGETFGRSTVLKAEVIHGIREEMAQTLQDVVLRRTEVGTAAYPGDESLEKCAALMACELQWGRRQTSGRVGGHAGTSSVPVAPDGTPASSARPDTGGEP